MTSQPAGDHMDSLDTKASLCIFVEAADFYVDTVDTAEGQ